MELILKQTCVHDTHIYGFGIDRSMHALFFDLDWIKEVEKGCNFSYLVSPSTLCFHNVWDISIDVEADDDIIIDEIIVMEAGMPNNSESIGYEKEYLVRLECLRGTISFRTVAGCLYQREKTIKSDCGYLDGIQRPIDFSLTGERYILKME